MPRGLVWAEYIRDDGVTRFGKLVDADQVSDPARGWTRTAVTSLVLFPTKAKPRRVFGSSPTTGRRGHTVVGNANAALWTGAVDTFVISTNDGGTDTIKVTFKKREAFNRVHP